jgi:DNA primase
MGVIDEIKSKLDIVDVISARVNLRKSGRNYKALCPFHAEKTPSFVVFPESQHWHCFGACSEGGDVFSFVMKQEGWDFRTALEELARQAGVELRPRTPAQVQAEEEADRLHKLLAEAARYYHHILRHAPEAEPARAYITRRGLSDETVEKFLLGYSLPGWDRTRTYLTEQGYTIEELVKAGLLVEREGGGTYDRFRERLMISIRDGQGRVIGFGARTLDPEGMPKYINSPQTDLFNKSESLYGLDLARRAIRRDDRVVIVEGYMDVMQAHQAGFENVVAQMGTALTEPQLKQLQRYTQRIVLALDPDAAGVQATLRGVEVAREALEKEWEPIFDPRGLVGYEARLGAEMRILRLPGNQDPDKLIRQDAQRWATLVEEAIPVVDFYLQVLLEGVDLEDTKVKAHVVDKLLPVLRAVANPVEREDYVQKVARALRVDARAVLTQLKGSERQAARHQRGVHRAPNELPRRSADSDLAGYCLSVILRRPGLLARINEALEESQLDPLQKQDFQDVGLRTILETWEAILATEHSVSAEALRAALPVELHARLEDLLASDDIELADEQLMRYAVRALLQLRRRNIDRLVQELKLLRVEAREAGDIRPGEYDEITMSYTKRLLRTDQALAQRWGRAG